MARDLHRDAAAGLIGKSAKQHDGVAHWAGVQSHYFMAIVADARRRRPPAIAAGENRTPTDAAREHLPQGTKPAQPMAIGTP